MNSLHTLWTQSIYCVITPTSDKCLTTLLTTISHLHCIWRNYAVFCTSHHFFNIIFAYLYIVYCNVYSRCLLKILHNFFFFLILFYFMDEWRVPVIEIFNGLGIVFAGYFYSCSIINFLLFFELKIYIINDKHAK